MSTVDGCVDDKMALKISKSFTKQVVLMRWLVALLTGYDNFRYHLKKVGLLQYCTFRVCLDTETAYKGGYLAEN